MFQKWIVDDLLPILLDSDFIVNFRSVNGFSVSDLVGLAVLFATVGLPIFALYFAIKKGRRLL